MTLASLNNSVIFKKLFRDPEVLTEFVRDVTGAPVQFDASHIELEKQFNPPIAGIDTRFDIFAEDPLHRTIVEIQRVRYDDHFDRFFHYHMVAILEQQKSYKLYRLQRTVYTIVWSVRPTIDPLYQKALITTIHESKASDGTVLNLYPHKLIFINPFHPDKSVPAPVMDWLQLASESVKNPDNPQLNLDRPIFSRASHLIEEQQITPTERAEIMDESEWERNLKNTHEAGRQDGLSEGRLAEKQENARKMLAKGLDPAFVASIVELPLDDLIGVEDDQRQ